MTNRQNRWLRRKFDELRDFAQSIYHGCIWCGSDEWGFAHVRPTPLGGRGRGRSARYYDILRHFDCYRPMCRLCHKEYDDGEVDLGLTYDPYWDERRG